MRDLIEALNILLAYGNPYAPLHCEHDVLTVVGIDPEEVSDDDKERLEELGFFVSEEYEEGMFRSYRFGSA